MITGNLRPKTVIEVELEGGGRHNPQNIKLNQNLLPPFNLYTVLASTFL